jgi:hypothetical protein
MYACVCVYIYICIHTYIRTYIYLEHELSQRLSSVHRGLVSMHGGLVRTCRFVSSPSRVCIRAKAASTCRTSGSSAHASAASLAAAPASYVSIFQHASAYVSIPQHTTAYVSIRQHTSACASAASLAACARRESRRRRGMHRA